MELPPDNAEVSRMRLIRADFDEQSDEAKTRNPTLCHDCLFLTSLFRRDKGPKGLRTYAQTWFTIKLTEDGARFGCPLCRLRLKSFSPGMYAVAAACEHVDFEFRTFHGRRGAYIRFNMYEQELLRVSQKLRMHAFPISGDMPGGESTGSLRSIELAKSWLSKCRCLERKREASPFLPTRLVEVGADARCIPRICETTVLDTGTAYVTLSHCWGGKVPLMLKQSNYARFLIDLPLDIPKTFADAMRVTRLLGFRYIWIDSLCIIQDSVEDWAIESARMNRVYQYSWCNIAATSARNHSEGLFTRSCHPSALEIDFDIYNAHHVPPDRWMRCLVWNPDLWRQKVTDTELLHRAWVVQEMLLSPRILHYADGQLFWECDEFQACTTFPEGIPPDLHETGSKLLGEKMQPTQLTRGFYLNQKDQMWSKALAYYTKSKLTFPTKDKLMAISAIARQLGNDKEYIIGLWKENLIMQLLWSVTEPSSLPSEWRAPSWSWASVDGGIVPRTNIKNQEVTTLVQILCTDIEYAGADPFGPVKSGTITLKGSIARLTAKRIFEPERKMSMDIELWDRESCIQVSTQPDRIPVQDGKVVHILPLQVGLNPRMVEGLMLEPKSGVIGHFHRCGTFRLVLGGLSSHIEHRYSTHMETFDRMMGTRLDGHESESFVETWVPNLWGKSVEWQCYQIVLL
ncbi:Nn.00g020740.m01.CDS01 [Neocucurbitaria sp. VM-36]